MKLSELIKENIKENFNKIVNSDNIEEYVKHLSHEFISNYTLDELSEMFTASIYNKKINQFLMK